MSITFPDFTIRKVDFVCGEVLRPVLELRIETELVLLFPEKEDPWADVIQISRFSALQTAFSEDGALQTELLISSMTKSLTTSVLPHPNRDRIKDSISTINLI